MVEGGIAPRQVFKIHLAIIAGLVLANVPIAVMDGLGRHGLLGYSRLLRLEEEANIPSIFSALALGACAVVAWAIRGRLGPGDRDRPAWGLLAAFFALLAFDEAAMLHELANRISRDLELEGVLWNLGVFVYLPILAWLAVRLLPFWLRQGRFLRATLFAGAGIYFASAFGVELLENTLSTAGFRFYDLPMRLSFALEESGEMIGVAVLLFAFLHRFSVLGGGRLVELAVEDGREQASAPHRGDSGK
jgi:hypothetical protein